MKWTVNSPESGRSHKLAGTYSGIEAVGNLFWGLECLFVVDEKRQDMRVELVDVIASGKDRLS